MGGDRKDLGAVKAAIARSLPLSRATQDGSEEILRDKVVVREIVNPPCRAVAVVPKAGKVKVRETWWVRVSVVVEGEEKDSRTDGS